MLALSWLWFNLYCSFWSTWIFKERLVLQITEIVFITQVHFFPVILFTIILTIITKEIICFKLWRTMIGILFISLLIIIIIIVIINNWLKIIIIIRPLSQIFILWHYISNWIQVYLEQFLLIAITILIISIIIGHLVLFLIEHKCLLIIEIFLVLFINYIHFLGLFTWY